MHGYEIDEMKRFINTCEKLCQPNLSVTLSKAQNEQKRSRSRCLKPLMALDKYLSAIMKQYQQR